MAADPTVPAGRPGDTRTIRHGAHLIHQVRTAEGWWNIRIEPAR
jgi:hypothetical protein